MGSLPGTWKTACRSVMRSLSLRRLSNQRVRPHTSQFFQSCILHRTCNSSQSPLQAVNYLLMGQPIACVCVVCKGTPPSLAAAEPSAAAIAAQAVTEEPPLQATEEPLEEESRCCVVCWERPREVGALLGRRLAAPLLLPCLLQTAYISCCSELHLPGVVARGPPLTRTPKGPLPPRATGALQLLQPERMLPRVPGGLGRGGAAGGKRGSRRAPTNP